MSETKTKNLCTVPAADLTDSQYFIAEDGGELKRIPKAQVVLKKLENMLATDTENLAGGGEVTAQELLDALAEQVANKLLAKSQVVNNLLATVEGNPLDATQGKALKELIDTTNNNLSKCNIGYSYNGTDGTNAIYTAIPNGSTVWFSINGNTKVGQELGLSQQYEGAEIIIWKSSDWRGGALAIGGDGSPVMIGQNNGSNSIKWNPLALKSDLFSSGSITNPNTCTVPFCLVNGWHSAITNVPDAAKGKYSILLNVWEYGPSSTGNLTSNHMQALIIEKGGGIFTRLYINSAWSDWA